MVRWARLPMEGADEGTDRPLPFAGSAGELPQSTRVYSEISKPARQGKPCIWAQDERKRARTAVDRLPEAGCDLSRSRPVTASANWADTRLIGSSRRIPGLVAKGNEAVHRDGGPLSTMSADKRPRPAPCCSVEMHGALKQNMAEVQLGGKAPEESTAARQRQQPAKAGSSESAEGQSLANQHGKKSAVPSSRGGFYKHRASSAGDPKGRPRGTGSPI